MHLSPESVTYYIIDHSHHKKLNYISNGVLTSARARLCLRVQTSANARLNAGVNGHVNQLLRYVKICILRCIHTDRDTDLPQKVTVEVHVLYCSQCLSVSIQNNYTSNTSGYQCLTSFSACFAIKCRRNREGGNVNLSSYAVRFWPSVFSV